MQISRWQRAFNYKAAEQDKVGNPGFDFIEAVPQVHLMAK